MGKDRFQVPCTVGLSQLTVPLVGLRKQGAGVGIRGWGKDRAHNSDSSDMWTFSSEDKLPLAGDCM